MSRERVHCLGLRDGGERRPGLGDRRLGGWLGPRLGLFALAINILLSPAERESTELDRGTVDFAVTRHPHRLLLIKDTALVVLRSPSRHLGGDRGEAGPRNGGGRLRLSRRLRRSGLCGAGSRIRGHRSPGIGGRASSSIGGSRARGVINLVKVRFG